MAAEQLWHTAGAAFPAAPGVRMRSGSLLLDWGKKTNQHLPAIHYYLSCHTSEARIQHLVWLDHSEICCLDSGMVNSMGDS